MKKKEPGGLRALFLFVWGVLRRGRWERGLARPACVRSRILRSPKHCDAALWLRPGAAPSSPLLRKKLKAAAWLRPCVILHNAKGF